MCVCVPRPPPNPRDGTGGDADGERGGGAERYGAPWRAAAASAERTEKLILFSKAYRIKLTAANKISFHVSTVKVPKQNKGSFS